MDELSAALVQKCPRWHLFDTAKGDTNQSTYLELDKQTNLERFISFYCLTEMLLVSELAVKDFQWQWV